MGNLLQLLKKQIDKTIFTSFLVATLLLSGCTGDSSESTTPNLVEINAIGLTFEAPDTIPSGWTTFRLNNQSEMIHFALFQKVPEGIGIEDHQTEVAPVFQNIMNDINGLPPAEPDAGFTPPEWYSDVQLISGPGLVSAGGMAETTFFVEPGTYLVECYVKTNGIFHSYNPTEDVYGMVMEMTVTADSTGATAPEPASRVSISSTGGFTVEGELTSGKNTIEVYFEDQKVYENFVGHDLHIVQMNENPDVEEISSWINWASPEGLETPSPGRFIAGTNEMPADHTAYIHVNFEPGEYMFIAEVPDPGSKGMIHRFSIE